MVIPLYGNTSRFPSKDHPEHKPEIRIPRLLTPDERAEGYKRVGAEEFRQQLLDVLVNGRKLHTHGEMIALVRGFRRRHGG